MEEACYVRCGRLAGSGVDFYLGRSAHRGRAASPKVERGDADGSFSSKAAVAVRGIRKAIGIGSKRGTSFAGGLLLEPWLRPPPRAEISPPGAVTPLRCR